MDSRPTSRPGDCPPVTSAAYVRVRDDARSQYAGQTLRVVEISKRRGKPPSYLCDMPSTRTPAGSKRRKSRRSESNDGCRDDVQLALAQAHVLWAKRHAPHLLQEWLDD